MDEVASVDDREDFAGVVVGDQDADLLLFQDPDEVLHIGDGDRIDVGKGLVEEEERGAGDEGAGDFEPPPLSSGKGARFLRAKMFEMELAQELQEAREPLGF